jgi:HEAT repeat protein
MADASEAYEQHWYRTMKERVSEDATTEGSDPASDILDASDVIALIECLDDPDDPVRVRVIVTLGELGDRRAVPALRKIAGHDPDPEIVILAKEALAHLDAP